MLFLIDEEEKKILLTDQSIFEIEFSMIQYYEKYEHDCQYQHYQQPQQLKKLPVYIVLNRLNTKSSLYYRQIHMHHFAYLNDFLFRLIMNRILSVIVEVHRYDRHLSLRFALMNYVDWVYLHVEWNLFEVEMEQGMMVDVEIVVEDRCISLVKIPIQYEQVDRKQRFPPIRKKNNFIKAREGYLLFFYFIISFPKLKDKKFVTACNHTI